MEMDNAKYMKRRVKGCVLEPDPDELAVIVNYEIEATILGDQGEPILAEKKPGKKKIRLKTLNENSNIPLLAEDLVDKCKLIPSSKIQQVEQILLFLQKRQFEQDYRDGDLHREETNNRRLQSDRFIEETSHEQNQDFDLRADMENLESYIEKLYDTMEDKVKGTYQVLQLARDPDNLDALVQNETLLGVLSRLLREDCRKSMDLCINIIYIFYSFSNFSQFHPVILNYHVGDMIMKVIELEIKRHALRSEELLNKEKEAAEAGGEGKDIQKERKKFRVVTMKQEKLLYVCFHVLLNLAEDVTIERKMKNRKIVSYLVVLLDRKNVELLILVVTFLKKLSIFHENKNEMAELDVVEKLAAKFVPVSNELLLNSVLRLLLNLSFDADLRERMVKSGLIAKLVDQMKRPQFQAVVLRLLYHISIDDRCKSMFTYTEAIPLITQMMINFPEKYIAKELVALAVNLTANSRNAEMMSEGDGLRILIKRALKTKDALLMKVIRNVSQHDNVHKHIFAEFVDELARLCRSTDDSDLLVELLGVLGNMTLSDVPFAKLLRDFDMINFLNKHLVPSYSEDDIVLEVIIFIGTCVNDPKCAPMFANSHLIQALYELMTEKQEDDEIVLQISFTFYKFLLHRETRDILMHNTQIVRYMLDLLQDKNKEIRTMADKTLDMIMELDDEWAKKIRQRKFEMHNAEWLQIITQDEEGYQEQEQSMMFEDDGGMDDGFRQRVSDFEYWNEQGFDYDSDQERDELY